MDMATRPFENKVVIVTGGATGIGLETSRLLAERGAKVAIASRRSDLAEKAAAEIVASGGVAIGITCDVSTDSDVFAMVSRTVAQYGRLDGAVNNAGIIGPIGPVVDYDLTAAREVLNINLMGTYVCVQAELRVMLEQGSGSIVNVGSIWSETAAANYAAYCTAKHGVAGLTKAAALEVGRLGVRVNAVLPGFTYTPMISNDGLKIKQGSKEYRDACEREVLGRAAHPREVAEAIAWLLSDASSYATGTLLSVDGGFNAR
jgi:NAD(P)-dependent dehydrogenase (short-subunit alcohol dehydrogenase family)